MKKNLRFATLAASALMALTIGFGSLSADAADHDMVRAAQERLGDLGYFSGVYDGILGPNTKTALKDFQRHSGLAASGQLNAATYDLLLTTEFQRKNGLGLVINPNSVAAVPAPEVWHYVGSEKLPIRNGELVVDEEAKGNIHRYTVKLNGRPFLLADNQPGALHISEVFHLQGEDAILMTAYRGEDSCKYKNYLVTIHASGMEARKHEFESCAPSSEVHAAHDALFIRFAETMNKDGYDRWDVWRYENTRLVRL